MIGNGDPLDSPYGGLATRIQALVAGAAPADLRLEDRGGISAGFLGATLEQDPSRFALASPVTHVDARDPPAFLYHGTVDDLVPIEHAERFKQALDTAGVPCEFFRVSLLGHASLFLLSDAAVEAGIGFLDRQLHPAD
jgi:dipeptidyl aminopeptidase/acylaminoacyl peptidase